MDILPSPTLAELLMSSIVALHLLEIVAVGGGLRHNCSCLWVEVGFSGSSSNCWGFWYQFYHTCHQFVALYLGFQWLISSLRKLRTKPLVQTLRLMHQFSFSVELNTNHEAICSQPSSHSMKHLFAENPFISHHSSEHPSTRINGWKRPIEALAIRMNPKSERDDRLRWVHLYVHVCGVPYMHWLDQGSQGSHDVLKGKCAGLIKALTPGLLSSFFSF